MSPLRPVPVASLADSQIAQWLRRGVTVLVGSWISTCGPLEPRGARPLPDGASWNSAIWRLFFGSPSPESLKQLSEDFKRLPFEALMQCYRDRSAVRSMLRKLYGGWAHNPLHHFLASALGSRRIECLITTNYDLCIDHCIKPEHRIATIYDKKTFDAYRHLVPTQYAPYYKIHGTALEDREDSLVFDLGSEKRMVGWKLELLNDSLRNRTLVVIGYSGRDFDICPDLASRTEQAETVWLVHELGALSPMAQRLLSDRPGIAVYGDGIKFLERIFGTQIKVESQTVNTEPELPSNLRLWPDWRLRVLNWMAAGELANSYLDDFIGTEFEKCDIRASICGHVGKYRDGARIYAKASRVRGISPDVKSRLQLNTVAEWHVGLMATQGQF